MSLVRTILRPASGITTSCSSTSFTASIHPHKRVGPRKSDTLVESGQDRRCEIFFF